MANIGQPQRVHEIEPVEEPVRREVEVPEEVPEEEVVYVPAYREGR